MNGRYTRLAPEREKIISKTTVIEGYEAGVY
jgi:hypothetical protein